MNHYALNSDEMKQVDSFAIHTMGIPSAALLELAGARSADHIYKRVIQNNTERKVSHILVLCGPGNNGGDGFVVARHLLLKGLKVHIFSVGPKRLETSVSNSMESVLKNMGQTIYKLNEVDDFVLFKKWLKRSCLVVDALFGVGLSRPLAMPYSQTVVCVNAWRRKQNAHVVSIDIPSGLDASTGKILGECVKADSTISFGFSKLGFFLNSGPEYCGKLTIKQLSYDSNWISLVAPLAVKIITASDISRLVPRAKVKSTGYKNRFGHVAIIAGSKEKSGAAVLASRAVMRSGAGLATLLAPASAHTLIKKHLVEVMSERLSDPDHSGNITHDNLPEIEKAIKGKNALLLGPGLKDHPSLKEVLLRIIERTKIPIVIDAQGLTSLGTELSLLKPSIQKRLLLTPHPGEMGRLLGVSSQEVQEDRVGSLSRFMRSFSGTVILKGAYTLIAHAGHRTWLCPIACASLATAGTGDVLAGMVASMLGQSFTPLDAALTATWSHAQAGLRFQNKYGDRGMIASDLLRSPMFLTHHETR